MDVEHFDQGLEDGVSAAASAPPAVGGEEKKDGESEVMVINDEESSSRKAKQLAWGRPEGNDPSESPSQTLDDEETINAYREELKNDKQLWPDGWQVVDSPAKNGFFIDKWGTYSLMIT